MQRIRLSRPNIGTFWVMDECRSAQISKPHWIVPSVTEVYEIARGATSRDTASGRATGSCHMRGIEGVHAALRRGHLNSPRTPTTWAQYTHDDDDEAGRWTMLTAITATRPSIALAPFTGTELLWFIPILVFWSRPDTYVTLVRYVKPPKEVWPENVDALVTVAVSIIVDWPVALPINQSLRKVTQTFTRHYMLS